MAFPARPGLPLVAVSVADNAVSSDVFANPAAGSAGCCTVMLPTRAPCKRQPEVFQRGMVACHASGQQVSPRQDGRMANPVHIEPIT